MKTYVLIHTNLYGDDSYHFISKNSHKELMKNIDKVLKEFDIRLAKGDEVVIHGRSLIEINV